MLPPKTKRESQLFLGIVIYLSQFSPMITEVSKPFRKLTSINAAWTWNSLYYNIRKLLHLETDASGVGLGAILLQMRDKLNCRYDEVPDSAMLWPITFASKSLSSAE